MGLCVVVLLMHGAVDERNVLVHPVSAMAVWGWNVGGDGPSLSLVTGGLYLLLG